MARPRPAHLPRYQRRPGLPAAAGPLPAVLGGGDPGQPRWRICCSACSTPGSGAREYPGHAKRPLGGTRAPDPGFQILGQAVYEEQDGRGGARYPYRLRPARHLRRRAGARSETLRNQRARHSPAATIGPVLARHRRAGTLGSRPRHPGVPDLLARRVPRHRGLDAHRLPGRASSQGTSGVGSRSSSCASPTGSW